jgi:hypothetical protein
MVGSLAFALNKYPQAKAIYNNKNWKYSTSSFIKIPILIDGNGNPYTITKNGRRANFKENVNNNGYTIHRYGPGNNNVLPFLTEAMGNGLKYFTKRNPKTNTRTAYIARVARRTAKKPINNAKAKRVKNLNKNYRAGRNLSKARLPNLVALYRMHQPSYGVYYFNQNNKNNGNIVVLRNNGKTITTPTRKIILANLANLRQNL